MAQFQKMIVILFIFGFTVSCTQTDSVNVRVMNMSDYTINWIYIGETQLSSITAHSKSSFTPVERKSCRVYGILNDTNNTEIDSTADLINIFKEYTISVDQSGIIHLSESDTNPFE